MTNYNLATWAMSPAEPHPRSVTGYPPPAPPFPADPPGSRTNLLHADQLKGQIGAEGGARVPAPGAVEGQLAGTGSRVLFWFVTAAVPAFAALTALCAMLQPWLVWLVYHAPGFPADEHGLTTAERMHYARLVLGYLRGDAEMPELGGLRFPPGVTAPPGSCAATPGCGSVFNPREISHLEDVRSALRAATAVWWASAAVLTATLAMALRRATTITLFQLALARGCWLTLAIIAVILAASLVSFLPLFDAFHAVLFASGTWVFPFEDTLIRLFPERFWRDAFLIHGLLSALLALAVRAAGLRVAVRAP